jgi:hypothetical protein
MIIKPNITRDYRINKPEYDGIVNLNITRDYRINKPEINKKYI